MMDMLFIVGVVTVAVEDDCELLEVEADVAVIFVVAGREIEDVAAADAGACAVVAVLVEASVAIIAEVDGACCVRAE